LPRDLAVLKARIIAAVKNIDAPMSMRVWQELEYRIDVCRVTRGAHTEHLSLSKELFQFSCGSEAFH
jgi:phage FluMu protein gp41